MMDEDRAEHLSGLEAALVPGVLCGVKNSQFCKGVREAEFVRYTIQRWMVVALCGDCSFNRQHDSPRAHLWYPLTLIREVAAVRGLEMLNQALLDRVHDSTLVTLRDGALYEWATAYDSAQPEREVPKWLNDTR